MVAGLWGSGRVFLFAVGCRDWLFASLDILQQLPCSWLAGISLYCYFTIVAVLLKWYFCISNSSWIFRQEAKKRGPFRRFKRSKRFVATIQVKRGVTVDGSERMTEKL